MNETGTARAGVARALRAVLLSGGLLLCIGRAAEAQFVFEADILPPRVVAWRLADRGYSGLGRPRFDGRVYVVDAVSPTGVPVRLFVDPNVGAVIGRQRLGPPPAYARLERPAPGFGWTEDDVGPPRALRPLPPGEAPAPIARSPRRPGADVGGVDNVPYGVNPDQRPDAPKTVVPKAVAPRKVARAVAPELKPALRTAPEAPSPRLAPAGPAQADGTPEQGPATPAAATTPPADSAVTKPAEGARAEAGKPAVQEKPAAQDWKDPPADRRPVRVIGGASFVPGTADDQAGAAR